MMDWDRLARKALEKLDAGSVMVLGARLRQEMEWLGQEVGFDVSSHVADSEQPFSRLLSQVDGIVIRRRMGADMLVGLEGAKPPTDRTSGQGTATARLRKDVWNAFTRLSPVPFVYSPGSDRFVPVDQQEGQSVPLPHTTLDDLIKDREEFANSLDDAQLLLNTLRQSAIPLADFRRAVDELELTSTWFSWQFDRARARVIEWADKNGVEPRRSWFLQEKAGVTTRQALSRLAQYLTTDEIGEMKIPIRAVAALLNDLSKH